jgi:O-antigen ligase
MLWQSACGALAVLLLWGCDSRHRLHAVALALFAGAVGQALWGAAALLGGFDSGWFQPRPGASGVAHGTFVNRNHFAGHLAMLGALGAGLLLARLSTARPAHWRDSLRGALRALLGAGTWLRVGLALVVVGLVLSHSRMGNLAFAFALAIGALVALAAWRPLPRAMPWLFASLLLVDLLLLGSWFGVERVAERIGETTFEAAPGRDSDAERWVVSAATLSIWRDHPWFGVGPGGFRIAFPTYKPASVALFYDHAHNDWAQSLAERGVVGTLPLVALFVLAIGAGMATVRARRDPRLRGIGLGAALGLLAHAVHGFADFNAQIPANAAAAWALMALALAARRQPRIP